jgi:transposase-like protein
MKKNRVAKRGRRLTDEQRKAIEADIRVGGTPEIELAKRHGVDRKTIKLARDKVSKTMVGAPPLDVKKKLELAMVDSMLVSRVEQLHAVLSSMAQEPDKYSKAQIADLNIRTIPVMVQVKNAIAFAVMPMDGQTTGERMEGAIVDKLIGLMDKEMQSKALKLLAGDEQDGPKNPTENSGPTA